MGDYGQAIRRGTERLGALSADTQAAFESVRNFVHPTVMPLEQITARFKQIHS